MRYILIPACLLALWPAVAAAQITPDQRMQHPLDQAKITAATGDVIAEETGFRMNTEPDLFVVDFENAECLDFYDEMGEASVGTCLLQFSGWQIFGVIAVTFASHVGDDLTVLPLTIIIE